MGNFNRNFSRGSKNFSGRSRQFNNSKRAPKRRGAYIDPQMFIRQAEPIEAVAYTAVNQIGQLPVVEALKQNLLKKGYTSLMPIQDQSIPHLLAGKDLIGIANTGTGKTSAFLVPMINKVFKDDRQKVLIVTPTRELAQQIKDELFTLSMGMRIYSVACIGGVNINQQIAALRRDPHFIIGTPGRLMDLHERRVLNLSVVQNVTIDEVDRMFDMGFQNDVQFILSKLPKERQSMFFSATINPKVEGLVRQHSNNPISVSVKHRDTSKNVHQDVVRVGGGNKIDALHKLLSQQDFKKILVFARTKRGVQRLSDELRQRGLRSEAIHGNKTQSQRQRALDKFVKDQVNVLVATDVVARGMDIPNVSHVINFDTPETYEDYIHRIGRTGRANNIGHALTFI